MTFIQTFLQQIGDRTKVALAFFTYLFIFWPGFMTIDSICQYQQALSGCYTNHHPPLMAFVWRLLNSIYPGPGMMLTLHFTILFSAVYCLMQTIPTSRLRYAYLGIPFIPHLMTQAGCIWKDVGFAFCFLLIGSYLARVTFEKRALYWTELIGLMPFFVYGTSVKFQAQYCAPVFIVWIAYLLANQRFNRKCIALCFLVAFSLYGLIFTINNSLVSHKDGETYSWQLVKLFDLAGMSTILQKDLIPVFCKTDNYSWKNLNEQFTIQSVDPLMLAKPSLIKRCETEKERNELLNSWWNAVKTHPIAYLKHRAGSLHWTLTSIVCVRFIEPVLAKIVSPDSKMHTFLYTLFWLLGCLLLSCFTAFCFMLAYLGLALTSLDKTPAAIPLLMFNLVSLTLFIALFFFTISATPRFGYPAICLTHFSHIFACLCFKSLYSKQY